MAEAVATGGGDTDAAPGELEVVPATPADRIAAVELWRAANTARGREPTSQRVTRVHRKTQDADALLVVARNGHAVLAMGLAEPCRADDGTGEIEPGKGHVSMVFVDPDQWGHGIGTALMAGLHAHAEQRGWTTLTLWTRQANTRAHRLYATAGYRYTGRCSLLSPNDPIVQLQGTTSPAPARISILELNPRPDGSDPMRQTTPNASHDN